MSCSCPLEVVPELSFTWQLRFCYTKKNNLLPDEDDKVDVNNTNHFRILLSRFNC